MVIGVSSMWFLPVLANCSLARQLQLPHLAVDDHGARPANFFEAARVPHDGLNLLAAGGHRGRTEPAGERGQALRANVSLASQLTNIYVAWPRAIPEPATLSLLATGVLLLDRRRRRA